MAADIFLPHIAEPRLGLLCDYWNVRRGGRLAEVSFCPHPRIRDIHQPHISQRIGAGEDAFNGP